MFKVKRVLRQGVLPLLFLGLSAAPVLADPPSDRGHGRSHESGRERDDRGRGGDERGYPERRHDDRRANGDRGPDWKHDRGDYRFEERHRDEVLIYEREHRYHCPPGLVETRHGCLPRGHTTKRYVVGQRLPSGVYVEVLPPELVLRLPPPPVGYVYRRVDGDILLIAEATKHVIDALVLFSAVR